MTDWKQKPSRAKPHRLSLFARQTRSARNKKPNVTESEVSKESSASAVEQSYEFIRVMASVLHPQIFYKTLPITHNTTAYEVVVALLEKYAIALEDQNPDVFYLTETKDSEQGSYSRVLENCDKVSDIQMRWEDEMNCYFTLCRRPTVVPTDNYFMDSPLSPVGVAVLSTSLDSYLSYTAYIEEGGNSPTLSELMSDSYFSFTSDTGSITSKSPQAILPDNFLSFTADQLMAAKLPRDRTSSSGSSSRDSGVMDGFHLRHAHHGHRRGIRLASPEHREETDPRESEKNSTSLDPLQEHILLHPNFACTEMRQEVDPVVRGPSFDLEMEKSVLPRESGYKIRKRTAHEWRLTRQMMQSSVDEGMQGIMNKVVTEQKALSSRFSIDTSKGLTQHHQPTSGVRGKKTGSVHLQPLMCSPVESRERQYPQFVFTPSLPRKGQELEAREGETDREGEPEREVGRKVKRSSEDINTQKCTADVKGNQSTGEGDVNTLKTDPSDSCSPVLDEVRSQHSFSYGDSTGASPPNCQATPPDHASSVPYSHHKTTKAMPVVLFKSQITVYPRFKSTADLYPSFACCEYFNSEMDIQGCLSSLLELEVTREGKGPAPPPVVEPSTGLARTEGVASRGLTLRPKQTSAPSLETEVSLISPSRRSKLIDQAAQTLRERRFNSLNLSDWENSSQAEGPSLLMSPSQRDSLVKQSVVAVRRRSKSTAMRQEVDSNQDAGEVSGCSKQSSKEPALATGLADSAQERELGIKRDFDYPMRALSSGRKYGSMEAIQLQHTSSSCGHIIHTAQSHLPTPTPFLSSSPPEPSQRHIMSRMFPSQEALLAATHTHSLHSSIVRNTHSMEALLSS